jgi:hypothetical protein
MSELTSQLQRMADDAARNARPLTPAEVIWQGDRYRRHSLKVHYLSALSASGVVAAGVALGLGLSSSAPVHAPGTIRTLSFTLSRHADGKATLTINPAELLDTAALQTDLQNDGIPAMVTSGSFCSSDPTPTGLQQVVSFYPEPTEHRIPAGVSPTITFAPAAIPAGTKLSFGDFRLSAGGQQADFGLVNTNSYSCTSSPPTGPDNDVQFQTGPAGS